MAVNDTLRTVAREFGTPAYVYFVDQIRERVDHVRRAFGNRFEVSYAIKCNPNPGLLARMASIVDILDVSSGGEVERAIAAGWSGERLSFTGPAKTREELTTALDARVGLVIVESVDEAQLLDELARQRGVKAAILVRIGTQQMPRGFGMNMSGKPSQFGIDAEDLQPALGTILALPSLDLHGFHIYSGSQCLKADSIVENYAIFIDLYRQVCSANALRPRTLIFGSGLGIPYYETESPLDLDEVATKTNPLLDDLKCDPAFAGTKLVIESGRYLVGQAGRYVTRVVRTKRSRGVDIALCDGGMNHHLGAAGHLGSMIQRNYRMYALAAAREADTPVPQMIVGPLCATIDVLGRKVELPPLAKGDLMVLESSGAYGVTSSPIHFLSHPPPKEILVETIDGDEALTEVSQFRTPQSRE